MNPVKPMYDDLLAKGYIKVAHALKPTFHRVLLDLFGTDRVKIAPIKELRRFVTDCYYSAISKLSALC